MKSKVLLIFLALVLVVSMAGLAACAAPEEEEEAPTVEEEAPPKEEEAPPVEGPKYGGILVAPSAYWTSGFDAHRKLAYVSFFTFPVFNNLVRFDPTKSSIAPEDIQGDLAERWEVSDDGKAITFYLRKGVKWHDGQPFTADDVVYSIKKMTDPERSAIVGNFPAYRHIEKIDDYTVRIHLNQYQPSFIAQLCIGYCSIQPEHMADTDWHSTDFLVGTGPFKFKSYVAEVSYEVERNPDYFRKDEAGNQLPYLDGYKLMCMPDGSARMDAFASKRIDQEINIMAKETVDRIKSQNPDAILYIGKGSFVVTCHWFNLDYEPLQDVRVRQALSLAVNTEEMVTAGYGDPMFRDSSCGYFAPEFGLPLEEVAKLKGVYGNTYEERLAEAKKLMKDAGYADGFTLKSITKNYPQHVREAEYYTDAWKRHLNIDIDYTPLPVAEANKAMAAGDYHTLSNPVISMIGDPDEVCVYFKTGAGLNVSHYSNPELDRLIEEQSKETDSAKRKQLVQEIERIVISEHLAIIEGFNLGGTAWWPYVKGWVPPPTAYTSHIAFEVVWLDK